MTTEAAGRRPLSRRLAWPIARVLVILAVGAVAVWKLDLGEVRDAFAITSWGFLALAVVANFISVGWKGLAWKAVVDALPSLRMKTRFRDILSPLFVGFLFNTVLAARLGEIVKVLLLRRRLERRGERPPTTTLLGTVVAENLVSTITWVGARDRDRALPAAALVRLVRLHRARRRLPRDRRGGAALEPRDASCRPGCAPDRSGRGRRGPCCGCGGRSARATSGCGTRAR